MISYVGWAVVYVQFGSVVLCYGSWSGRLSSGVRFGQLGGKLGLSSLGKLAWIVRRLSLVGELRVL